MRSGRCTRPRATRTRGWFGIDPKRLEVTDEVPLPTTDLYNQEGTIAAGEGAIWVVIDGKGCEACLLVELDPQTLETTHEIDLDPGAESVAVGNGLVWVSDSKRNRVLRIDQDRRGGRRDQRGRPALRYLAVDSNGVWVLNQLEGTVMQLDPKTVGELIRTINADMAGAGGSITGRRGLRLGSRHADPAQADRLRHRRDRRPVPAGFG